jgi:hypothetical protein
MKSLKTVSIRQLFYLGVFVVLFSGLIFSCNKISGTSNSSDQPKLKTEVPKENAAVYRCPMHPTTRFDHPGDCPICNMKLERLPSEETAKAAVSDEPVEKKIRYYRNPMDPSIHSDRPMKDSMGMDYVPVYEANSPRVSSEDGKTVARGAFTLTPDQLKLTGTGEAEATRMELVATARVPGRVIGGSRVSFQAFEQDLTFIKTGMEFEAESPSLPGEVLRGRITTIASMLDPMTRTVRVDGVVSSGMKHPLRIEASLVGKLRVKIPGALSIPENAVIHTGDRDIVYISDGTGGFTPRIVVLGIKADGRHEVTSGLAEGEKVSSGPNFLLDSESRIEFSE